MNHAYLIIMNNYAIITNRRLSLLHAVLSPGRDTPEFIRACDYSALSRGRGGGARGARGVQRSVPKLKL